MLITHDSPHDNPPTRVFFVQWDYSVDGYMRDEPDRESVAIFPDDIADYRGNVSCFAHIGQHGAADLSLALAQSRARTDEYASLVKELTSYPYHYNLEIMSESDVATLRQR